MIDTKKFREIGKWMMLIGGGIFTSGAGICFITNRIDANEIKKEHKKDMLKIEKEQLIEEHQLKKKALRESAEKDRLYKLKIGNMNDKEFAKFHANNIAKANEEVIKKADAEIVKTRLECRDEIEKIRSECLRKIEEANDKRDEAIEKYEKIDNLFNNKNEIIKAKESLEKIVEQSKEAKKEKDELLDSIREIIDK